MSDALLQLVLAVVGAYVAAYTITTIIVAVADTFGLVYSWQAEERRHRDDDGGGLDDVPAHRLVPVMAWKLDLEDPAILAAIEAPPPNRTPLGDRIAIARRLTSVKETA